MHTATFQSQKLNLSSREAASWLGSPRLFQRLVYHRWLHALDPYSKDKLYPTSRVMAVQARMEAGEMPPLLPSEVRQRETRRRVAQAA